jgi:hypothetical protein
VPQTRANLGELLRTLAFAATPGLLRVVGAIPILRWPSFPRDRVMDAPRHGRSRAPCARLQEHRTRNGRVRIGMGVLASGCRSHRHPLRDAGVVRKRVHFLRSDSEDNRRPSEIVSPVRARLHIPAWRHPCAVVSEPSWPSPGRFAEWLSRPLPQDRPAPIVEAVAGRSVSSMKHGITSPRLVAAHACS